MSTRSVVAAVLALAVGSAAAMPLGVRSVMHGRAAVMQISAAGTESAAVSVSAGGEASVEEREGGGYVVTAKDGGTVGADGISVVSEIGGEAVDVTAGYDIVVAADGKSATVRLKVPAMGVQAVAELPGVGAVPAADDADKSGVLASAADVAAKLGASAIKAAPKPQAGEELGALPVKTVRGLWYRASWGEDLHSLTAGDKVQATGQALYLGVIRQTGPSGFYRLQVSER